MKVKFLCFFVFCAVLTGIAAKEKYMYAETSYNEFNIPFVTDFTFREYHPGFTAGFGFPLTKGNVFYLYNKNEAGWNRNSQYQDKIHGASIIAPEWHLLPWLDLYAGLGAGASLLLQKSVYSMSDGTYKSVYPIFALEGLFQSGVRFSIPGINQLHIYAEYELQVSYFGLTCPKAIFPLFPTSSFSAGLLWKFGGNK